MSSPEARGLTEERMAEHGDPDSDLCPPTAPEHWRQQEEDLDRFLAEHPFPAGSPGAQRRTAVEVPFDRARFDDSLELARDQLAFPPPDPEIDDDEMEIGR